VVTLHLHAPQHGPDLQSLRTNRNTISFLERITSLLKSRFGGFSEAGEWQPETGLLSLHRLTA
jgi:hypothetical protein